MLLACLACSLLSADQIEAQPANSNQRLQQLQDISITQKLDSQVPLSLEFTDENGKTVKLQQFFTGKPVVLSLVYYECPMLCTEILNGVLRTLRVMKLSAGEDFQVVTVSIDPDETPELAQEKKSYYLERYKRPTGKGGWHFLTGSESSIRKLAESVGFGYRYEPKTDLYSHSAGIMILTPEGRVAGYQLGVEYSPRDLRLALVDASSGKIGTPVDQILLYCYRYDPSTGKYSLVIMGVLRIAALLTVLAIVVLLAVLIRRDRTKETASAT